MGEPSQRALRARHAPGARVSFGDPSPPSIVASPSHQREPRRRPSPSRAPPPLPSPSRAARSPSHLHPPRPSSRRVARRSQGAAAAGTFSSKGALANAYSDGAEARKTSEEVAAFYMSQIEKERAERVSAAAAAAAAGGPGSAAAASSSSLPSGWEERARVRDAEAKAYGVAAPPGQTASGGGGTGFNPPSLASPVFGADRHARAATASGMIDLEDGTSTGAASCLLSVATHALEQLARTLRATPTAFADEERAAFAAAVKRSMDAVARCRA
eukprot:28401-Pelagococcus_subviridis.AAC.15